MDKKSIQAIKRHRTARLAKLGARAYYLHRKKLDNQIYGLICDEFVALGGVYMKFLQGVLLRSKMVRLWESDDKLRIFENLDTEPLDLNQILRKELTPDGLSRIRSVQPEPFAAGTFGQVYYGELSDGRPIIIKVLRPMIRETLKYDLKLLDAFMRRLYVKLVSKNVATDAREAMREFANSTLLETDYKSEVAFAVELYKNYEKSKEIFVPETFVELCTDNIIVQEYVSGISVAHLLKLKEQGVDTKAYVKEQIGSDLDEQLEVLGYELLRGAFAFERIQGDPHPGNIRLLPNNQVGLIDFGISAKSPEDKAAFLAIIEAYDEMFKGSQTIAGLFDKTLRFFVRDLYRALLTISRYAGGGAEKALPKQLGEVAEKSFEQMTGKKMIDMRDGFEEYAIIDANRVFNEGNRFGLILKFEDTTIMRASQSYITLLISLGRYKKVLPKIVSRVVEYVRTNYPEATQEASSMPLNDALETVSSWLERIADKDPSLFKEITEKIRNKTDTLNKGENDA